MAIMTIWKILDFVFAILTIHNDTVYVKHFLDPLHVLFTLIWCLQGGGGEGGAP